MDLIVKLFDVLFPVFLIIGIGYWYGKKDPKFDTKFITTFSGNFGLPAIIFYSFTTTNISIELFLRFYLFPDPENLRSFSLEGSRHSKKVTSVKHVKHV